MTAILTGLLSNPAGGQVKEGPVPPGAASTILALYDKVVRVEQQINEVSSRRLSAGEKALAELLAELVSSPKVDLAGIDTVITDRLGDVYNALEDKGLNGVTLGRDYFRHRKGILEYIRLNGSSLADLDERALFWKFQTLLQELNANALEAELTIAFSTGVVESVRRNSPEALDWIKKPIRPLGEIPGFLPHYGGGDLPKAEMNPWFWLPESRSFLGLEWGKVRIVSGNVGERPHFLVMSGKSGQSEIISAWKTVSGQDGASQLDTSRLESEMRVQLAGGIAGSSPGAKFAVVDATILSGVPQIAPGEDVPLVIESNAAQTLREAVGDDDLWLKNGVFSPEGWSIERVGDFGSSRQRYDIKGNGKTHSVSLRDVGELPEENRRVAITTANPGTVAIRSHLLRETQDAIRREYVFEVIADPPEQARSHTISYVASEHKFHIYDGFRNLRKIEANFITPASDSWKAFEEARLKYEGESERDLDAWLEKIANTVTAWVTFESAAIVNSRFSEPRGDSLIFALEQRTTNRFVRETRQLAGDGRLVEEARLVGNGLRKQYEWLDAHKETQARVCENYLAQLISKDSRSEPGSSSPPSRRLFSQLVSELREPAIMAAAVRRIDLGSASPVRIPLDSDVPSIPSQVGETSLIDTGARDQAFWFEAQILSTEKAVRTSPAGLLSSPRTVIRKRPSGDWELSREVSFRFFAKSRPRAPSSPIRIQEYDLGIAVAFVPLLATVAPGQQGDPANIARKLELRVPAIYRSTLDSFFLPQGEERLNLFLHELGQPDFAEFVPGNSKDRSSSGVSLQRAKSATSLTLKGEIQVGEIVATGLGSGDPGEKSLELTFSEGTELAEMSELLRRKSHERLKSAVGAANDVLEKWGTKELSIPAVQRLFPWFRQATAGFERLLPERVRIASSQPLVFEVECALIAPVGGRTERLPALCRFGYLGMGASGKPQAGSAGLFSLDHLQLHPLLFEALVAEACTSSPRKLGDLIKALNTAGEARETLISKSLEAIDSGHGEIFDLAGFENRLRQRLPHFRYESIAASQVGALRSIIISEAAAFFGDEWAREAVERARIDLDRRTVVEDSLIKIDLAARLGELLKPRSDLPDGQAVPGFQKDNALFFDPKVGNWFRLKEEVIHSFMESRRHLLDTTTWDRNLMSNSHHFRENLGRELLSALSAQDGLALAASAGVSNESRAEQRREAYLDLNKLRTHQDFASWRSLMGGEIVDALFQEMDGARESQSKRVKAMAESVLRELLRLGSGSFEVITPTDAAQPEHWTAFENYMLSLMSPTPDERGERLLETALYLVRAERDFLPQQAKFYLREIRETSALKAYGLFNTFDGDRAFESIAAVNAAKNRLTHEQAAADLPVLPKLARVRPTGGVTLEGGTLQLSGSFEPRAENLSAADRHRLRCPFRLILGNENSGLGFEREEITRRKKEVTKEQPPLIHLGENGDLSQLKIVYARVRAYDEMASALNSQVKPAVTGVLNPEALMQGQPDSGAGDRAEFVKNIGLMDAGAGFVAREQNTPPFSLVFSDTTSRLELRRNTGSPTSAPKEARAMELSLPLVPVLFVANQAQEPSPEPSLGVLGEFPIVSYTHPEKVARDRADIARRNREALTLQQHYAKLARRAIDPAVARSIDIDEEFRRLEARIDDVLGTDWDTGEEAAPGGGLSTDVTELVAAVMNAPGLPEKIRLRAKQYLNQGTPAGYDQAAISLLEGIAMMLPQQQYHDPNAFDKGEQEVRKAIADARQILEAPGEMIDSLAGEATDLVAENARILESVGLDPDSISSDFFQLGTAIKDAMGVAQLEALSSSLDRLPEGQLSLAMDFVERLGSQLIGDAAYSEIEKAFPDITDTVDPEGRIQKTKDRIRKIIEAVVAKAREITGAIEETINNYADSVARQFASEVAAVQELQEKWANGFSIALFGQELELVPENGDAGNLRQTFRGAFRGTGAVRDFDVNGLVASMDDGKPRIDWAGGSPKFVDVATRRPVGIEDLITDLIHSHYDGLTVIEAKARGATVDFTLRLESGVLPFPVIATAVVDIEDLEKTELRFPNLRENLVRVIKAEISRYLSEKGSVPGFGPFTIKQIDVETPDVDIPGGGAGDAFIESVSITGELKVASIPPVTLTVVYDIGGSVRVQIDAKSAGTAINSIVKEVGLDFVSLDSPEWYSLEECFQLFLAGKLDASILGFDLEAKFALSHRGIRMRAPIRISIPGWYDFGYVAFGNLGVGLNLEEKEVLLNASMTMSPGAAMEQIFRLDGEALASFEESFRLTVTGDLVVVSFLNLARSVTILDTNQRLFQTEVKSGEMLSDLIQVESLLRIQDLPPHPFFYFSASGELLGAKLLTAEGKLQRDLSGYLRATVDLPLVEASTDFTFNEKLSDPRFALEAEIGIRDLLGIEIHLEASKREAYLNAIAEVIGFECAVDLYAPSADLFTKDWLYRELMAFSLTMQLESLSLVMGGSRGGGTTEKVDVEFGGRGGEELSGAPSKQSPESDRNGWQPAWKWKIERKAYRSGGILGTGFMSKRKWRYEKVYELAYDVKDPAFGQVFSGIHPRELARQGIHFIKDPQSKNHQFLLRADSGGTVMLFEKRAGTFVDTGWIASVSLQGAWTESKFAFRPLGYGLTAGGSPFAVVRTTNDSINIIKGGERGLDQSEPGEAVNADQVGDMLRKLIDEDFSHATRLSVVLGGTHLEQMALPETQRSKVSVFCREQESASTVALQGTAPDSVPTHYLVSKWGSIYRLLEVEGVSGDAKQALEQLAGYLPVIAGAKSISPSGQPASSKSIATLSEGNFILTPDGGAVLFREGTAWLLKANSQPASIPGSWESPDPETRPALHPTYFKGAGGDSGVWNAMFQELDESGVTGGTFDLMIGGMPPSAPPPDTASTSPPRPSSRGIAIVFSAKEDSILLYASEAKRIASADGSPSRHFADHEPWSSARSHWFNRVGDVVPGNGDLESPNAFMKRIIVGDWREQGWKANPDGGFRIKWK